MENKLWIFGAFGIGAFAGFMLAKSKAFNKTSNFAGDTAGVPLVKDTVNASGEFNAPCPVPIKPLKAKFESAASYAVRLKGWENEYNMAISKCRRPGATRVK